MAKYNMGCGFNQKEGWINCDKFSACKPDLLMDIEALPWPIEDDGADEVMFIHCLEHVGGTPDLFIGIMKELYRVCKKDAKVRIHVPHPNSDGFLGDPTHVRVITPMVLSLFSRENNEKWKKMGASNSPLAFYHDVDFAVEETTMMLAPYYQDLWKNKKITRDELNRRSKECNNIVEEIQFLLRVKE
jgi:ubiquinone/menaquinone biosynthesis C-methylase UbiE